MPISTGLTSIDPGERTDLQDAGFAPCAHPGCSFLHAPGLMQEQTCPQCKTTPEMADSMYNETMQQKLFNPGGGTHAGITMKEQGDLGEEVVKNMKEIPGYGPITWWAGTYNSPLDGATAEWGIEVRTYNIDNAALQFNIGPDEKVTKNAAAAEQGFKGILATIVVLDYRRSLADIYVKPFTLAPWTGLNGRSSQGVGFYRPRERYRLVTEVPFSNPYKLPHHGAPRTPTIQHDEMPF